MAALRSWDIFCRVIDNLGDIGVCWRLSAELASRGQRVRLWVDDPSPLSSMAPGALEGRWPGVRVLPWSRSADPSVLTGLEPADVWVEGFGCEPEPAFVAHRFGGMGRSWAPPPPVWINLEYLSAERFAERCHGLPSPLGQGPAKGHVRWFFYPGLAAATGGLLRETDLAARRAAFDRAAWLARWNIRLAGEQVVSMFCYEPAGLGPWMRERSQDARPTLLLVPSGRASAAVRSHLGGSARATEGSPGRHTEGSLSIVFLPPLTQPDFDHLLWACDANFVRGEDSLVRALWAGKPFVWQIYPQSDQAHQGKLAAMLDAWAAPASWREFHRAWNGLTDGNGARWEPDRWAPAVESVRSGLEAQPDLCQRLCAFVDRAFAASGSGGKQS
jgi:uncharacterized repeat protein (TIGR03837 family)